MRESIILTPNASRILIYLSFFYLLLPQMIFMLVVLKSVFLFPIMFGYFLIMYNIWKTIPVPVDNTRIPKLVFLLSLLLAIIVFLFSGAGSVIGWQMGDYVRTNAMLSDLYQYSWPVLYNIGNDLFVLNYYIADYVLPALLGKMVGSFRVVELSYLLWNVLGLFLGIILVFVVTKVCKCRTLFALFNWAGLDCIGYMIISKRLFGITDHLEHWANTTGVPNGHIANYSSFATGINWGAQHYIPVLLAVFIFLYLINYNFFKMVLTLSSILLFWSPLAAVGFIPFFLLSFIIVKRRKHDNIIKTVLEIVSLSDIISIFAIALPIALYFLSMNLGVAGGRLDVVRGFSWLAENWKIFILFILLEFGICSFIIWKTLDNNNSVEKGLLLTSFFTMLLCLFVDYGLCHDFSMRATIVSWFIIFSFVPSILDGRKTVFKLLLMVYILFAFITSFTEYSRMVVGVWRYGCNVMRAEYPGNSIKNSDLKFQYLGNSKSFFFDQMCHLK